MRSVHVAVVGAVALWRWSAWCRRHGAVSRILRLPLKPTEARLHATMLGCTPENCQRRPRAEVCQMITSCDAHRSTSSQARSYVSSHPSAGCFGQCGITWQKRARAKLTPCVPYTDTGRPNQTFAYLLSNWPHCPYYNSCCHCPASSLGVLECPRFAQLVILVVTCSVVTIATVLSSTSMPVVHVAK